MALLTADDVLNKKFQPTKFREGYDQDEVDDFLDEVVNTLRVVGSENEELKAKLEAAEQRVAELSSGGAPAAQDAAEAPAEQTAQFSPGTSQEATSAAEQTPADQGEETPRPRRPPPPNRRRVPRRPAPPAAMSPPRRPACCSWPSACTTSTSAT